MIVPPPGAAVARFRGDVARLIARGRDGVPPDADTRVALAVSGGPDSMAMLALAAAAFPGRVVAATVDHRLRTEAAAEARLVAATCAALGVPHATLMPATPIAGSSIQMRAREARYAMLTAWAERQGAMALMTAHHADDQAETLLMRLNRASGLSGLSAIRAVRRDGQVLILRPVLDWRRGELHAIAVACGIAFVDDPSNRDDRHDRTRIRALFASAPGLDTAALARSAAFLADAEEVIARQVDVLWSDGWNGSDQLVIPSPRELRRRLVRRAIHMVRAAHAIARPAFTDSANVEPLLDALEAGKSATQGGILVTATGTTWTFRPAPARRTL